MTPVSPVALQATLHFIDRAIANHTYTGAEPDLHRIPFGNEQTLFSRLVAVTERKGTSYNSRTGETCKLPGMGNAARLDMGQGIEVQVARPSYDTTVLTIHADGRLAFRQQEIFTPPLADRDANYKDWLEQPALSRPPGEWLRRLPALIMAAEAAKPAVIKKPVPIRPADMLI